MDGTAVIQSAITGLVSAGAVVALMRSYIEKRIAHAFDVQLEAYKADLAAMTPVRTRYAQDRLEEYQRLVTTMRRVNRWWKECIIDPDTDPVTSHVLPLLSALEDEVYSNTIALEQDDLYVDVQAWKVRMQMLTKGLDNAMRLDATDPSRATSVRRAVNDDAPLAVNDGEDLISRIGGRSLPGGPPPSAVHRTREP